ncbi:MAG TPA: hypothetical protein VHT73_00060 [Thermodesulfobacteriota bacterium]|nr:hypothetical protein [Thermodesulfobacteriota bacterium]
MKEKTIDFSPDAYGPVFSRLLQERRLNPLDSGSPNTDVKNELSNLTIDSAFSSYKVADMDMAKACIATVWLYHNYLEKSHEISQSIDTQEGSYWHGIMHRREPDFQNSKYWFRRVGEHPIFKSLHKEAKKLASDFDSHESTEFLIKQTEWNSIAFIDFCEACIKMRSPGKMLCRQIQQREWELLFDYCYRNAVGR